MSKYTTGEMAKLCHVTVRTVQYYDSRKLLVPSQLSEGGRRLYSEADLNKLKIICFLRGLGISIDGIKQILLEEDSAEIIAMLLQEQVQVLEKDISQQETRLRSIKNLQHELKGWSSFSVESIKDIVFVMENKKKMRKVHLTMLVVGIFMDIIEIFTFLLGIIKGIWLPFFVGIPIVILCGILLTRMYYKNSVYICPHCHAICKPTLKEFLFSAHTPKTRKLTCKACGYKGYCVETHS